MGRISILIRDIWQKLRISRAEPLCFYTYCDQDDPAYRVLARMQGYQKLRTIPSLKDQMINKKKMALVTVVGPTRRRGFLAYNQNNNPVLLPAGWWGTPKGGVHLFAFTSFSASIMDRNLIGNGVERGVGLRNAMWAYINRDNEKTVDFLIWSIDQIRQRVFHEDRITRDNLTQARSFCELVLSLETLPRGYDPDDVETILSLICLLRQKEDLVYVC